MNDSKKNSLFLPWTIGFITLLLLSYLALGKGCNKSSPSSVPSQVPAIKAPAVKSDTVIKFTPSAPDAAKQLQNSLAAPAPLLNQALPSGLNLSVPENGIESRLIVFIEDKTKLVDKTTWFTFDRLYFETGKATLESRSDEQLKNIAAVMTAYPDVHLKIGGYTDNTGNPKDNLKLSSARAMATMNELIKLGVAKKRLAAEGYGDQFPVTDNSTEEYRAKNRRIDLRVSKK
jgi:OmpA-OmpF porin, OOP family